MVLKGFFDKYSMTRERSSKESERERLTATTAVFSTKGSYKTSNFSSSKKK